MGLIDQLTEKSWLPGQGRAENLQKSGESTLPVEKLGLRVFLGVITVLFSLFVVAYIDRMTFTDWRPLPMPWLMWLNTAVLVLSGVGMQKARIAANRGEMGGVRTGLLAGGGFAIAFLAGQLWASQQLVALGYYAESNPANAFFYLITAVHAVHLLGGLVAWGRTAGKVWRGLEADQVRMSVGLCAVYWHFLLVVWLVLFGLLLLT
ncbi:MAG: cytochrome c oxidase subunit 3 [Rhodospirillales bacterium]